MSRDHLSLGPTPADEPCAALGEPDYEPRAKAECRRFIDLLRETFGPEPPGAFLTVKGFPHDFGTYYEVVCYYEESDEITSSAEYAYRLENEAPTTWPTPASPSFSTTDSSSKGDLNITDRFNIEDVRAHSKTLTTKEIPEIESPTVRLVRMLQHLDHGISHRVTDAVDVIVHYSSEGNITLTLRQMLSDASDEINDAFNGSLSVEGAGNGLNSND